MLNFFTNWEADPVASDVAGWTVRAGTATFRPVIGTPAFKRRYLALTNSASGEALVTLDAADADADRADANLVIGFAVDDFTGESGSVYLRWADANNWYRIRVDKAGAELLIEKRVAGVTTELAAAAITLAAGTHHYVRAGVDGTALAAKIWSASCADEPAAETVTATDSSISAAGRIGLSLAHATLASKVFPVNFVSLATGGTSQPGPRTNAEFAAWLEQNARRIVLAELAATGYDSSGTPYTKTVKAYVSNGGFVTEPWDTPPNRYFRPLIKRIPTFSREMGPALSGQISVGFGSLVLKNAAVDQPEINSVPYELLLEAGDRLLLEDGSFIILE